MALAMPQRRRLISRHARATNNPTARLRPRAWLRPCGAWSWELLIGTA